MSNKVFNSISEVRLHTNRKGVIQIINTILKNVSDKRRISSKDSFERILKMIDYINTHHKFNVSCLIDWDNCTRTKWFKSNSTQDCGRSGITNIINVGKDNYYLGLIVEYEGSVEVWKKVLSQYIDTQWLVDSYIIIEKYIDRFGKGKIFCGSLIMENNKGETTCINYECHELNELIDICPIHYGWVNLIELDLKINVLLDKEQTAETEQEISLLKRRLDYLSIQWVGFLNEIQKEVHSYSRIDMFSPFYFPQSE